MRRCVLVFGVATFLAGCEIAEPPPRTLEDDLAACRYYEESYNRVVNIIHRGRSGADNNLARYWRGQLDLCERRGYRSEFRATAD